MDAAATIFEGYQKCPSFRSEPNIDGPTKCIAYDELFKVFGEGETPEEVLADLEDALRAYFELVLASDPDDIRAHVDTIVDRHADGEKKRCQASFQA